MIDENKSNFTITTLKQEFYDLDQPENHLKEKKREMEPERDKKEN